MHKEFDTLLTKLINSGFLTVKKRNNIFFFDIFEIVKNIKQINSLIKLFKTNKNKKGLPFKISFIVPNKFIKLSLDNFAKKFNLKNSFEFHHNPNEIKSGDFVFILSNFNNTSLNSLLKRLSVLNIYVFVILSKHEEDHKFKNGFYSFYGENSELKNLFFTITLLNKMILNV